MVHELKKRLRQAGIVPTRQRILVLKSLVGRKDHPDAERLFEDLRRELTSLSLDTVYRNLNTYSDAGLIQRLALPVSRAHFDGNVLPHDHCMCMTCQLVMDLDVPLNIANIDVDGIREIVSVHSVQRLVMGYCRNCIKDDQPIAGVSRGKAN